LPFIGVAGEPGHPRRTATKGKESMSSMSHTDPRDAVIEDVDLLVVGGGKAGKTLAMEFANAGGRVAMIEQSKIGGTCINVACIPTKTIIDSGRF
jgi:heterodisulfide reductase subunit A-like polyferredoxin